jgi:hypothetical protein
MAPTVVGIDTGAVTAAANPTVTLTTTPEAGDVLIVSAMGGGSIDAASAMAGCGATWTRIPLASTYLMSFWMGVGATSAGTITATGAAHANGKALRVHHLRGVEPVVAGQQDYASYKMRATSNQIVIALGYSTNETAGASLSQTSKAPGGAWTDQTEIDWIGSNGRTNSTYLIPTGPTDCMVNAGSAGVIMTIGNPVAGTTVTEKTMLFNGGFEASVGGWQSTNSNMVHSADAAMFGTRSLKITATAAVPGATRNLSGSHPTPFCIAGLTYTASIYVRSVTARNGRVNLRWAPTSGTVSSTTNGTTTALPANTWVRLTVTGVAPAAQYIVGIGFEATDGISGDVIYLDGAKIQEGATATDFIDGSVTTANRLNINMGGRDFYTVQTTLPPAPTPSVQGVFYGAYNTGANPTVDVTNTPAPGDVLILGEIRGNVSQAGIPDATAVSGCGATWTKIGGGHEYQNYWIGTGATFSGTVTATAADPGPATYGRHLRVHQLRGVSPDVYIQQYNSTYPVAATSNQIVIVGAMSQSSTDAPIAELNPVTHGWTTDTETVLAAADRRYNSAHVVPKYQDTLNVTPNTYGTLLVIGSPVAGMEVVRRNLVGNPSIETNNGEWLGSGTSSRSKSLTTAAVGAASITANYNASATAILRKATGSNGPQGPAVAGRTYTVSGWVRCNNARDAGITMMWLSLNQSIMVTGTYNALTPLPANTWTRVSWTGVAPAGTCWVAPECKITGCLAGDVYWWDGFLIEEGVSVAGDYFDGSTAPPPGDLNYFVGASDMFTSVQLHPIPLVAGTVDFNQRESGVWVSHTGVPKVYHDAAWITRVPKYWDGAAWIDLT